ncbi:hypothetical protein OC188_04180, partial [Anaplasma capra]|uniref:hypothetical protein n=1 Tax=Anaplasma capra TaxID=1562740 RepID=UPI0021D5847B
MQDQGSIPSQSGGGSLSTVVPGATESVIVERGSAASPPAQGSGSSDVLSGEKGASASQESEEVQEGGAGRTSGDPIDSVIAGNADQNAATVPSSEGLEESEEEASTPLEGEEAQEGGADETLGELVDRMIADASQAAATVPSSEG